MLGYLTTDAKIDPAVLSRLLRRVVDESFNAITVDGECSTNDCVFAMASGASGVAITRDDDPVLLEPMRQVAGHLAREIVRGGEGATKLVTVHITGALSNTSPASIETTPSSTRQMLRGLANRFRITGELKR